jgi:succinyl-CoA synthetase alpha subunit
MTRFKIFRNFYRDSVTLMQLAAKLREEHPGVERASCLMATPANVAQLCSTDGCIDVQASPSDLLVVVCGDAAACDTAIEAAARVFEAKGDDGERRSVSLAAPVTSLAQGFALVPTADLALISVPGDYAAAEALKALSLGLHVMVFSDNVPIREERIIKVFGRARDLLVMGPDCGTAIINGVPLGFANAVRRGGIGLVSASGTGLQEVVCRIHNCGGGISQAIGAGGRDLHEEVGGITMLQGLSALAADDRTRVIVLVSKPAAPAVARDLEEAAGAVGKPVVMCVMGAAPRVSGNLVVSASLHHAADAALALDRGEPPPRSPAPPPEEAIAAVDRSIARMASTQMSVRGFFTGGTFCYEAHLTFIARGLPCRSNAPAPGALLSDGLAEGHVLLDLGDDRYTRGRPHPMIDPAPRDAAVRAQGAAPATAAILFDVVLGFGSHPDPAGGLAQALADAQREARRNSRTLAMIGHVCGTDADPQDKAAQVRQLEAAGAVIVGSSFEAATLAARVAARTAARS